MTTGTERSNRHRIHRTVQYLEMRIPFVTVQEIRNLLERLYIVLQRTAARAVYLPSAPSAHAAFISPWGMIHSTSTIYTTPHHNSGHDRYVTNGPRPGARRFSKRLPNLGLKRRAI